VDKLATQYYLVYLFNLFKTVSNGYELYQTIMFIYKHLINRF